MGKVLEFLRARLIAGLFFTLPFIVLLLIGRELLEFIHKLLGPIASRLPTAGLTGPAGDYLVAAMVLILVAFIAGVLASIPQLRGIRDQVELTALRRIPGYYLFKNYFQTAEDETGRLKVLFVTLDDAWLFGFLLEELPDGMLAVFVPGVPSPTSGSLYFFTEHQVRRTDISVRDAVRTLSRLGVGSGRLVTGRLPAEG
jgi:uncharacterized membrane protein